MKAAVDQATSRTLIAGAAGAFASGAAVQSGMVTAAAVVGVAVTPVGIAILGTLAAAGVWKVFATPRERHRRDLRERSRDLEEGLRKEILTNLPQFEHAVDVVVSRFRLAAIPEITGPRVEAERIREIADAHRSVAQSVAKAANLRIDRLLPLLPDDFGTPQSREL
jgi:hypothetical protein